MRLPRKKDLERKQQAILKFTQQSFTDVRFEVTKYSLSVGTDAFSTLP